MTLRLRHLTAEERIAVEKLAHSRTAPARSVERARVIWHASRGEPSSAIAAALRLHAETVRRRIRRFNTEGLVALEDQRRSGRPATYSPDEVAVVIATTLTAPRTLDLPFAAWTLDRLATYLHEHKGIAMKRSRIDEILLKEGLRWRQHETWFGDETLYTAPPEGSLVICLDEMGPVSAKSYPGRVPVRTTPSPVAGRARQAIDYGRRGKGYIFGAFRPATGAAFTHPYPGRSTACWVDFLERVEHWLPSDAERVYAIADNLSAHPRWEMVFQPKSAAYLNLIEPWWKVLRSLALAGRRFESWDDITTAIEQATSYWNAHRHPFTWRHRRRHHPRRHLGIAMLPTAA
jgi:transposase